ncbi:MAG: hypothetical protein CVT49_07410 [candidate division Zixibacteria bacterium HGW-Zixibacteria-1]|nr:MAG: hypothetical protein CVT49_07410 [candidate division Zixibacteria bacterium HGW-Zixibacteria-1]
MVNYPYAGFLFMTGYSKEFLDRTIETWQQYYARPLTREDAREIADNMTGLFNLLEELDRKYGKEKEKA